jgi:hypothetical protein
MRDTRDRSPLGSGRGCSREKSFLQDPESREKRLRDDKKYVARKTIEIFERLAQINAKENG